MLLVSMTLPRAIQKAPSAHTTYFRRNVSVGSESKFSTVTDVCSKL